MHNHKHVINNTQNTDEWPAREQKDKEKKY